MRLLIRLLGLVNVVILARLLTPEDFGIVVMATLVAGLLQLFADVSVDLLLLRRDSISQRDLNVAWTLQVVAGITISLVLLACSPLLVAYYAEPRVELALYIVALAPAIAGFENTGVVMFRREFKFNLEFWYWVVRHLIRFAFGLGLALALQSYVALALAVPMSAAITVAVSFWLSPLRPRLEFIGLMDLWRAARWLVTLNVSQYVTWRADEFVVGGFAGSSNMGAYYVAADVATIANRELVGAIGRAIYPTIALVKDSARETRQAFVRIFAFHAVACLAIGTGLALVAPELVPLLLGEQWLAGIPVFQWIALCSIAEALILVCVPFFVTGGHERFIGLFHLGHALVLIACLVIARSASDFVLIAQVRVMVAVLALGICLEAVRRLGHVRWDEVYGALWRPVLAALAMWAALWCLPMIDAGEALSLFIKVGLGAFTYSAALFILWRLSGRPASAEHDILAWFSRVRTSGRAGS